MQLLFPVCNYRPTWNWQCGISCRRITGLFYAITSTWIPLRERVSTIREKINGRYVQTVRYVRYVRLETRHELRETGRLL